MEWIWLQDASAVIITVAEGECLLVEIIWLQGVSAVIAAVAEGVDFYQPNISVAGYDYVKWMQVRRRRSIPAIAARVNFVGRTNLVIECKCCSCWSRRRGGLLSVEWFQLQDVSMWSKCKFAEGEISLGLLQVWISIGRMNLVVGCEYIKCFATSPKEKCWGLFNPGGLKGWR